MYLIVLVYITNLKCQEKFDILRILRGTDSEHMKKGSCTIPINISETHVVKFIVTSVEA